MSTFPSLQEDLLQSTMQSFEADSKAIAAFSDPSVPTYSWKDVINVPNHLIGTFFYSYPPGGYGGTMPKLVDGNTGRDQNAETVCAKDVFKRKKNFGKGKYSIMKYRKRDQAKCLFYVQKRENRSPTDDVAPEETEKEIAKGLPAAAHSVDKRDCGCGNYDCEGRRGGNCSHCKRENDHGFDSNSRADSPHSSRGITANSSYLYFTPSSSGPVTPPPQESVPTPPLPEKERPSPSSQMLALVEHVKRQMQLDLQFLLSQQQAEQAQLQAEQAQLHARQSQLQVEQAQMHARQSQQITEFMQHQQALIQEFFDKMLQQLAD